MNYAAQQITAIIADMDNGTISPAEGFQLVAEILANSESTEEMQTAAETVIDTLTKEDMMNNPQSFDLVDVFSNPNIPAEA